MEFKNESPNNGTRFRFFTLAQNVIKFQLSAVKKDNEFGKMQRYTSTHPTSTEYDGTTRTPPNDDGSVFDYEFGEISLVFLMSFSSYL